MNNPQVTSQHIVQSKTANWLPKESRLGFVDSLRGLAALYVVVLHVAVIPKPNLAIPVWFAPWVHNGLTSVTMFFVISAFTLCLTLDGNIGRENSTYRFYMRRIFRIVPLYYVWLVVMAVWWWGLSFAALRAYKLTFILYATFGYNFVPGQQNGLVWGSWTLGIEMIFYLAFPFIFRVVTNLRRSFLFLGLSLLLSYVHAALINEYTSWPNHGYSINSSIFSQLPIFAVGISTYFTYRKYKEQPSSKLLSKGLLLGGVSTFLLVPYIGSAQFTEQNMYDHMPIYYAMAIAYALILLGLSFTPVPIIVNRITVFFGLISYSVYLNNLVIIYLMVPIYQKIYATNSNELLHYFTCLLVTLTIVTSISWLTYKLIEEPCIALGRRFSRSTVQSEGSIKT